jgi:phosphopantetheine adenylyltransferase
MPWYHSTIEGHIDVLKYARSYHFDEFFALVLSRDRKMFLFTDPNQRKHLGFRTKKFGWPLYLELPVANVT